MLFHSFNLFMFILVLNIILGSNKKNNIINIFEKIKNNKQFHIRINKSLAENIKNVNINYESTEFDLLYEELVKQKLKNYQRLMDLRKKEKNYEKKKRRDKKYQDKVVRSKIKAYYLLIGDYSKYYEMSDSFNLIEKKNKIKNKYYEMRDSFNFIEIKDKIKNKYNEMRDLFNFVERKNKTKHNYYEMSESFNLMETKNEIKNKLYEIIFKGTSFWKGLGKFLELLGICAIEYMFVSIFFFILWLLAESGTCACATTCASACTCAATCASACACTATCASACACSSIPCVGVAAGIYGGFILLIIITVLVVALLVIWLWPNDDKNFINKILESK
ncbi:Plasmodium exported protein (hyp5), unknown, putative [Plasmodium sp.]|nr:Plasmodium exported protein (hyp5), unknown, putative [Plasmodium sp.]